MSDYKTYRITIRQTGDNKILHFYMKAKSGEDALAKYRTKIKSSFGRRMSLESVEEKK